MTQFELQIIALILVAFAIGVVIGYFLRTRVFPPFADEGAGITLESRQKRPAHALLRGGAGAKSKAPAKTAAGNAAKPAAKPASKAEESPGPKSGDELKAAAQPSAAADNLQEIKGIGEVLEKKLKAMGIDRFEQIAKWTDDDIAEVDEQLNFRGRIQREKWVEQAQELAKRQQS